MKEDNKDTAEYIKELEDKIVDLSLQLRCEKKELYTIRVENHEQIKKIVHNLKNPIGAAYSFSEILEEGKNELSSEKRLKYLNIIKNSSEFSIKMLNSLGDLNQLKSPNFKLNKNKINYNTLINSIINYFEKNLSDTNIFIQTEFSNNNIYLTIDEEEITKVINIILSNAVRYSKNKPSIYIKIQENERAVETVISDNGIGIFENNLVTIFDEFSAVNTYSENGQKCIGLGLSIAKKIIKFHKGQISAQSSFDRGSIFKFIIPK